jgi:predicted ATP-grasp superfamily ATP-dependent carboligase
MNISSRMTASDSVVPVDAATPKILLTATNRWPSAARLMIEFYRIGHVVSILCPVHHPSEKLRVAHRTFRYKTFAPLDSLAEAIETAKPDIIIPCDDLAVRHLHSLHSGRRAQYAAQVDIPGLIAHSLGSPEGFTTVDSRYMLLEAARQEGIPTPETHLINSLGDLERWRSTQPFPWVLKADGTTGGVGVRIVHTLEEARHHCSALRRRMGLLRSIKRVTVDGDLILQRAGWHSLPSPLPGAVVVQPYIRGGAANCAVVCWKGEVLAGVGCEAVSTETPVGPATVVRLVDNPEMMTAAQRLARRLNLSGFFGLDFVIEQGTGAAHLIEMNPRCTPPSHLRLGVGRDMIGALSGRLTGQPPSEPVSVTQNNLIAYFPQAFLRQSEYLSTSYHDLPAEEPELIEELCRPLSNQGIIKNSIAVLKLRPLFSRFACRLRNEVMANCETKKLRYPNRESFPEAPWSLKVVPEGARAGLGLRPTRGSFASPDSTRAPRATRRPTGIGASAINAPQIVLSAPEPSILLLSQRRIADLAAYCLAYEFEDTVASVADAAQRIDVADLRAVEFSRRAYKLARVATGSSSLARRLAPFPRAGVVLERDFDLFFPVFSHAYELYTLATIPNWRQRCRKAACFIDEVWSNMLPEYLLELLSAFDHVFIGDPHSIQDVKRITGRPCSYLPAAVDVLRFAPASPDQPRSIKVCNIGRRSQVTHQALLDEARRDGYFYYYDTVAASGSNLKDRTFRVDSPQEHRRMLATLLKNSCYYIANRGYVNRPEFAAGPDVISARFYQGAAAGTVMIGEAPRTEEFKQQFDWPDAVVHVPFDSPDIGRILQDLDGDPERLRAVRRNNVREAALRHDWLHRIQAVFDTFGLAPTEKMRARAKQLEKIATQAKSIGVCSA